MRTYRPKSCIIQIHGITTPHLIRSTTCVFENSSIEILILRVFVALTALTELCERHVDILDATPVAYLPVRHQASGPWRERHEKKMNNLPRFRESLVLFLVLSMSLSPSMEPT